MAIGTNPRALAQMAMTGFPVVHVKHLDECIERDTFSGGINVSARARNGKLLRCYFDNSTQRIYCGRHALAAISAQVEAYKPMLTRGNVDAVNWLASFR